MPLNNNYKKKKYKSLKYPFGFDKYGNIYYPWRWDHVNKKKIANDKIANKGDQCGLEFKGIKLSYTREAITPHFKSQKGENASFKDQNNINMTSIHLLSIFLIRKNKIVPIPKDNDQRYLIHKKIANNWAYDVQNENIFHINGKNNYSTVKDFILKQTIFNLNNNYLHNLTEINYDGEYFGIDSIISEMTGASLIDDYENPSNILNYLNEEQIRNFRKKKFDLVGLNPNKEPIVIIEVVVKSGISNDKKELLEAINISSVITYIAELDPYDPETNYPVTHENTFWIKNVKFENELNLLQEDIKADLINNYNQILLQIALAEEEKRKNVTETIITSKTDDESSSINLLQSTVKKSPVNIDNVTKDREEQNQEPFNHNTIVQNQAIIEQPIIKTITNSPISLLRIYLAKLKNKYFHNNKINNICRKFLNFIKFIYKS